VAKYLVKASYSGAGIKGVMAEGASSRVAVVEKMMASVGGSLESFHFAFGGSDLYAIADLPDNTSAAAVAAAVASSGALSSYETVVLLTPAEMDAAMKKAVAYRAPGS
jgi:uncharacterized protein with GYD domain